jgi:hypothetical protein
MGTPPTHGGRTLSAKPGSLRPRGSGSAVYASIESFGKYRAMSFEFMTQLRLMRAFIEEMIIPTSRLPKILA